jgi:hypothetical protein
MDLTSIFIKGLANYGLTLKEITDGSWKYSGGNRDRHRRYYKILFPNTELPPYSSECVCGHYIVENCYISNEDSILIIGNCCIKKFMPKNKSCRTCEICSKPHKNRKDNKCKECRKISKIHTQK